MEKFEIEIKEAKKSIQIADHMMNVTYKVVNDPKLLLSIVERISNALKYNISGILHYERFYKRIPPFSDDFQSMFNTFKLRVTKRYNINIEYITLIHEVNNILEQHKNSPIEFRKNDKFVIFSDNYRMQIISNDIIKKMIEKSKLFIKETENMVNLNG